jgi:histidinol-phosphate/aromatic aminotransferase/cobyric acid decarboxylase-like protein
MQPDLSARLKKYQIPWSVNALAQKMGIVALEDNEYSIQTRKMVDEQRARLFFGLDTIPGIRVFPSQVNFLLFQLSSGQTETAHQFYMNLMKDGLLVRNCGNFSGLDKSYFRVAVRTEQENNILVSRIEAELGEKY